MQIFLIYLKRKYLLLRACFYGHGTRKNYHGEKFFFHGEKSNYPRDNFSEPRDVFFYVSITGREVAVEHFSVVDVKQRRGDKQSDGEGKENSVDAQAEGEAENIS